MNPSSSAVALFVKDECHDIAGWISWHLAIGFDHLYIYDDWSTDGTYEIARAAAQIFNVTVTRTSLDEGDFFLRQKNCYFDAIQLANGKHDWIALLDGDEYVSLSPNRRINDFLSDVQPDVTGIALNWCIYGSGSKALKDNLPTYEGFNFRADESLDDNTLVKSLVRPEAVIFSYESPHRFALASGRYADAAGKDVHWRNGPTKDVLWEHAHVNHYICRSMEHYIGRISRRLGSDLSNSVVYWDHFNKNDVYEPVDRDVLREANEKVIAVKRELFLNIYNKALLESRAIQFPPLIHDRPYEPTTKKFEFFDIVSHHGSTLCINHVDGHVVQGDGYEKVIGILFDDRKKLVITRDFDRHTYNVNFHIKNLPKKSYAYLFDVEAFSDTQVALRSPENGKYLTSLPPESGTSVELSRSEALGWEIFTLIPNGKYINACLNYEKIPNSEEFIYEIENSLGGLSFEEFCLRSALLSTQDRKLLIQKLGAAAEYIL